MFKPTTLGELLAIVCTALIFLLLGYATRRASARRIAAKLTEQDRDQLRGKVAAARFERHIRARLAETAPTSRHNPGPGLRPHPCPSLADAAREITSPRPWVIPPAELPDPFPARPGETVDAWAKRIAKATREETQ